MLITTAFQSIRRATASYYQNPYCVLHNREAFRRSTMSRLRILAVAVALGAVACGSSPTTAPTPTTPVTVTDTFAGTLTANGAASYTFTTATSGTVTATLATLAPNSTLVVGLALGTWSGNACQIVLSKDSASQF